MPLRLPIELLNSLEDVKGFDKEAFIKIHESGEQVTSVRMNPFKLSVKNCQLPIDNKIPWTDSGYYLVTRPSFTFDPLFHAGCYYVQEASSMFLELALKQTVDLSRPLRVLDLCAAPGGKSTDILSLISSESLLVSNEVIRSRANILNDNIIKWGCSNVVVTNNDPKDFQRLENYFDVIVVDAPCSGSGLFRRDPEAIEEWSEQNVALCSQRQQRILSDVLPSLKNGGVLIYSTCSYSKEEDEFIAKWLNEKLIINHEELIVNSDWNITKTDAGYRFWPDKIKGEGFFIACFRKNNGDDKEGYLPKPKSQKFSKQERELLNSSTSSDEVGFIRNDKSIHVVPEKLQADVEFLLSKLRIVNYGTRMGDIIRDKLIPDHALAMSIIAGDKFERVEVNYEQAIQYLKKKELNITTAQKGWVLITYQLHPLGWVNILPNRINNYYPKELRILKD